MLENEMWSDREKKCRKGLFLCIVGIFLFVLLTRLFYFQSIRYGGLYWSDLPAHIGFARSKESYSLLYWIMGIIMNITESKYAIPIFESLIVIATWLVTARLVNNLMKKDFFSSALIALGLLFLTSIYIPFVFEHFYLHMICTQPWHNITYLAMRLFAVLAIDSFFSVYEDYLEKMTLLQWGKIAVSLLLTTLIKPNYLCSFAFTLLIVLIIDFCKLIFGKSQFVMKKFANIVIMGTTVFPACIVLWYQSNILFETSASGGESGIAIMFAEWFLGGSFKDVILKFFCGCSFPLIVMIHERKRMTKKDNFIYLMFLVTLCQVSMLGETGRRATHYNFYWGLYNSAYLLFAFAISKFCDVWRGERKEIFYKVVGIVLLGAHLISGITYFLYVYSGFTPWNM